MEENLNLVDMVEENNEIDEETLEAKKKQILNEYEDLLGYQEEKIERLPKVIYNNF